MKKNNKGKIPGLSVHPLKFKEAVSDILKAKPKPKEKPRRRKGRRTQG